MFARVSRAAYASLPDLRGYVMEGIYRETSAVPKQNDMSFLLPRIGEALGLRHSDFTDECRVLHVQRSVWRGKPQQPKTKNAVRVIDIHDELAKVLREHVRQTDTYLFATRNGTPLVDRNVLKALHGTGIKVGFHALRRYRTETLRRARVPEDLIRLWLGHSSTSITDLYAEGLHNDEQWRREWCERAGLDFAPERLKGYTGSVVSPTVERHVTLLQYVN